MSKFTVQERYIIYNDALAEYAYRLNDTGSFSGFMCIVLFRVVYGLFSKVVDFTLREDFPELYSCKPKKFLSRYDSWFDEDEIGWLQRVTILFYCISECEKQLENGK